VVGINFMSDTPLIANRESSINSGAVC